MGGVCARNTGDEMERSDHCLFPLSGAAMRVCYSSYSTVQRGFFYSRVLGQGGRPPIRREGHREENMLNETLIPIGSGRNRLCAGDTYTMIEIMTRERKK